MVTSPTDQLTVRQQRNDRYLAWVEAMVAEIPLTVEEWPALPSGERASFAAEWDNYMGMFETLSGDCFTGDLTTPQRDRLDRLAKQLVQLHPLLADMALHGPDQHNLARLLHTNETKTTT